MDTKLHREKFRRCSVSSLQAAHANRGKENQVHRPIPEFANGCKMPTDLGKLISYPLASFIRWRKSKPSWLKENQVLGPIPEFANG